MREISQDSFWLALKDGSQEEVNRLVTAWTPSNGGSANTEKWRESVGRIILPLKGGKTFVAVQARSFREGEVCFSSPVFVLSIEGEEGRYTPGRVVQYVKDPKLLDWCKQRVVQTLKKEGFIDTQPSLEAKPTLEAIDYQRILR